MRKSLLLLGILLLTLTGGKAQNLNAYLRERALNNLKMLSNDPAVLKGVEINDRGIIFKDQVGYKVDISAYWVEIGKVVSLLEEEDYHNKVKIFTQKRDQTFYGSVHTPFIHYTQYPTSFEGLYVAIDPGHFGGDLESARQEARLVKIAAADLGTKRDIIFHEADLAYCTALFLKQMLEEKGATVMLTRPYGAGAIGEDFTDWLNNGGIIRSANSMLRTNDITTEYHTKLLEAYKLRDESNSKRNDLFQFYKFVDFRERARKINEFDPNITLSIHFNAHDDNPFYGDRYLHPVKENYNMMFVPGAFIRNELSKPDQKLDFLRLLLSPDIENSINLADLILDEHEKILGVPRRPALAEGSRMSSAVIDTHHQGVFARNLVLTRMPVGTVVYGESLLQDNITEAVLLGTKDITVHDPAYGDIPTSSRVKQVALAYFNGIQRYLQSNVKKSEIYNSLTASNSTN